MIPSARNARAENLVYTCIRICILPPKGGGGLVPRPPTPPQHVLCAYMLPVLCAHFCLSYVLIFRLCSESIFSVCYVSIFSVCYVRFLVCVM